MKNRKIVFLAGIHGVGKSTLGQLISKKYNLKNEAASTLIKKINNKDYFHHKLVDSINSNQEDLIIAINTFFDENKTYLLDGHFCLLNVNQEITKIPAKTFKEINPLGIIILTDTPKRILERLNKRDHSKYDLDMIERFNKVELEYGSEVSNKYRIPYIIHDVSSSEGKLLEFLEKIIN